MSTNSTYQQIVDQFRANAATATPTQLALYAKAIQALERRPDFDFAASLGDFAATPVATVAAAAATELGAVTTARSNLASSIAAIRTARGSRQHALRGGDLFGLHAPMRSRGSDPYRFAHNDSNYWMPYYQHVVWDEASDRIYQAQHVPMSSANDTYMMPAFAYQKADKTFVQLSSDAAFDKYRFNPTTDTFPAYNAGFDSRYAVHLVFPLCKSTDATNVKMCLVSFRIDSASRAARVRRFDENFPVAGTNTINYYDTACAAYNWLYYDTTNKCLVTKNSDGNNTERRTLYWDAAIDSTAAANWSVDTVLLDTSRCMDIGGGSSQVNRKFWVDGQGRNRSASPQVGPMSLSVSAFLSPNYMENFQVSAIAAGVGSAYELWGRYMVQAPSYFHMIRDAAGAINWRGIKWQKQTRTRDFGNFQYIAVDDPRHQFLVSDKDGTPLRYAEVDFKVHQSTANSAQLDYYPRIAHIFPLFWHPYRDELHLLVHRVAHGGSGSNSYGCTWSKEIVRL